MKNLLSTKLLNVIVIVAALGYFVDIYDLILFGIVKNPSLTDLGLPQAELFSQGNFILSMQMAGMLLGGIVWGILGDKKGRLSILFMTILLYSVANIANGFITSIHQYAWLRFLAGFGLSGEFGLGVTMVSEVMSKEKRGLGASIVSGIGIVGAVFAFFVAERFSWRTAYFTGGALGLLLLLLRIAVYESGMYEKTKSQAVSKGNFFALFTDSKRFRKFAFCTLLALPTWYTVSVLAINAPSFAQDALRIIRGHKRLNFCNGTLYRCFPGQLPVWIPVPCLPFPQKSHLPGHYKHCCIDGRLFFTYRSHSCCILFCFAPPGYSHGRLMGHIRGCSLGTVRNEYQGNGYNHGTQFCAGRNDFDCLSAGSANTGHRTMVVGSDCGCGIHFYCSLVGFQNRRDLWQGVGLRGSDRVII